MFREDLSQITLDHRQLMCCCELEQRLSLVDGSNSSLGLGWRDALGCVERSLQHWTLNVVVDDAFHNDGNGRCTFGVGQERVEVIERHGAQPRCRTSIDDSRHSFEISRIDRRRGWCVDRQDGRDSSITARVQIKNLLLHFIIDGC